MKVTVEVSGGSTGMFSMSARNTKVTIECQDYEMGQATVTALNLLAAHGIGETPDGDEDSVGTTSESVPPEAFGETGETAYPEKGDPSLDAAVSYAQSVARSMGDGEKPRSVVEDFRDGQE